jgi:hypothetical protein
MASFPDTLIDPLKKGWINGKHPVWLKGCALVRKVLMLCNLLANTWKVREIYSHLTKVSAGNSK